MRQFHLSSNGRWAITLNQRLCEQHSNLIFHFFSINRHARQTLVQEYNKGLQYVKNTAVPQNRVLLYARRVHNLVWE
eukprot:4928989-Amphidinium_carterae.1